MASRYGHSWVSQFGAQPDGIAGAEWRSTLSGVDRAGIEAGFRADRARGAEWPPSSTKFRAMCFAIPSLAAVKLELKKGPTAPGPFARMVWSYIDSYRYRNATAEAADFLLKDAYEIAREAVMSGTPLPDDPVGTLDAPKEPKPVPASPEAAKAHLAEIQRILGVSDEPAAD